MKTCRTTQYEMVAAEVDVGGDAHFYISVAPYKVNPLQITFVLRNQSICILHHS